MFQEIHIWEFPKGDMSVNLDSKFKRQLFTKAYKHFGSAKHLSDFLNEKAEVYNRNVNFDWRFLWWQREKAKFIPFWVIYEIAGCLKIDKSKLESNIKSYKSFRSKKVIYKPKLPVEITPEFTAIAVHMMGDGNMCQGRFFFFQEKEDDLECFKAQVENVFGEYEAKCKRGHYVPKILSLIVSKYYGIKDYSTFKCRVPRKIYEQSKFHKLATLTTFLSDEGHVSGRVIFTSSNKKFLKDMRNLAISLGYKCTQIIVDEATGEGKQKHNNYSFKIRTGDIEKFYNDIRELIKKYPTCLIKRKFNSLRRMIEIRNRGWKQRGKGKTKEILLKSLKSGPKTAFELRDIANVTLWTVYHHLQDLMQKDMVVKGEKKGRRMMYLLRT